MNAQSRFLRSQNALQQGFSEHFSNTHDTVLLRIDDMGLKALLSTIEKRGMEIAVESIEEQCDLIGAYEGDHYVVQFPRMLPLAYTFSMLRLELEDFQRRSGPRPNSQYSITALPTAVAIA